MYGIIKKDDKMDKNSNITSRDKDGIILINGEFLICIIPVKYSR